MWKAVSRSELCRIVTYRGGTDYGTVSLPDDSSITQMIKGKLNQSLFDGLGLRITHATIRSKTSVLKKSTSGGNVLYTIDEVVLRIEEPKKLLRQPILHKLNITDSLAGTRVKATGQFRLFYSDSGVTYHKGKGVGSELCKIGHDIDKSKPANFYIACLQINLTEIIGDTVVAKALTYLPKLRSGLNTVVTGIIDQHMPFCIACDENEDKYKSFKDKLMEKFPMWKGVVYTTIDAALKNQASGTNKLQKGPRHISLDRDMISWIAGNKSYVEFQLHKNSLLEQKHNSKTGEHAILVQQTVREKMGLLLIVSAADYNLVYDSIRTNINLIDESPY